MQAEVVATDEKIQNLNDQCAQLFAGCSNRMTNMERELEEIKGQAAGMTAQEWHRRAEQELLELKRKMEVVEGRRGPEVKTNAFPKHRGLIPEKECRPDKFDGEIGKFRRWRNDFMEFVDAQRPGLKKRYWKISQRTKQRVGTTSPDKRAKQ